ncbi:MAG: hypothetical protein NTV97_26300 [Alphaproteobacteria bacterium]|nr:hypothetical protein [Alphaproteobacteria bacterium]
MSGGLHVSPPAVVALKEAIEKFARQVRGLADEAIEVGQQLERDAEADEEEASDDVRRARRALSTAADDDRAGAISDLANAVEDLRDTRQALTAARRTRATLRRAAERAQAAVARQGVAGPLYLERKLSELAGYIAAGVGEWPQVAATHPLAVARDAEAAPARLTDSPALEELEKFPLPAGWKWVRLIDIDTTRLDGETLMLDDETRDGLTRRFDRLRRDVLPLLDRNRAASADRVREADDRRATGDTGALDAFETFFSRISPIHLQRAAGSRRYTIDDGRHRIDVARALGWPAVPARALDRSPGA